MTAILRKSGNRAILIHPCDECGRDNAPFGFRAPKNPVVFESGIVKVGQKKSQPNAHGYAEKWVDTPGRLASGNVANPQLDPTAHREEHHDFRFKRPQPSRWYCRAHREIGESWLRGEG